MDSSCSDPSQGIIRTVEMHTGGEPLRIIVSGYPPIPDGTTLLEKRQYVRDNLDHLRRLLMFEPRGHDGMYGALLVKKDLPEAVMAVLFLHGEGYSTMCGHATIALGRYAVDYGIVPPISPVTSFVLQCPCGPVKVKVQYKDNKTGSVSFESVPSFVVSTDQTVYVPTLNTHVSYHISYGGAFYAIVDANSIGLDLQESSSMKCREVGGAITDELRKTVSLSHPTDADLAYLLGTILVSDDTNLLTVYAEKLICRAPCGSGVTAKVALEYHQKSIQLGESKRYINPKTKSSFTGRPIREVDYEGLKALIVEVEGTGYYTGECKFWYENEDEIGQGFLLN